MGESVKPHLEKLWAQAKKDVEAFEGKVKPDLQSITEKVKKPKAVKSQSVIAKQMKDTLADQGIELGIEYDPINIEQEVEKAQNLVQSNPAEAKRIAYSSVKAVDLLNNAVRLAYFNQMVAEKNWDEAAKIGNWIRAENTRLGQEIVVNKGFVDDTSPMKFIKQLVTAKMAAAGRKFGRGKKGSAVKKVATRITKEVKKVREMTEAKQMDFAKAQQFIEKLRC